jgi:MFS superfamily sulfate permease-like transporter
VATAGVIVFGVLEGILIAVALSILLFFRRSWKPHGEVLGRTPTEDRLAQHQRDVDIEEIPDVLVFRWEAPLFFANAGIFRQQVRALVRERQPRSGSCSSARR